MMIPFPENVSVEIFEHEMPDGHNYRVMRMTSPEFIKRLQSGEYPDWDGKVAATWFLGTPEGWMVGSDETMEMLEEAYNALKN